MTVRFLLMLLLFILFGYSLALVFTNHADTPVDLLFAVVPAMNLGLILVITLGLGIVVGLLLGVLVFRVVQNGWEIKRLKKELDVVRARHIQAAAAAAAATAAASTVIPSVANASEQPPTASQ